MFTLFNKRKKNTRKIKLKIDGMHCTSCSMNIDGELEDTPGVIVASTNYAKSESVVEFDSSLVSEEKIKTVIASLGYTAEVSH